LSEKGWILSPLFDVNPNPYGEYLSLNISETDSTLSLELALDASELYGISSATAKKYITEMKNVVSENWRQIATKNGISRSEQSFMESAFSAAD
jgi:serine/threonine-protein kinase HipA